METVVVALGGNAILKPGQAGTFEEQYANVVDTARQLVAMTAQGFRLVVTHGNGPQVGNLLIQNEEAAATVPPMPLHVLGAESQGLLGYMIQQALQNAFAARGLDIPVSTVLTQVVVARDDPAFGRPTKPVGPFFTEARARRLMAERGYVMREDAGRGWRRVVPSPDPVAIRELEVISRLVDSGSVVVACGGGGIPVVQDGPGVLEGVDAVIDKDLASACLARGLGADVLLILTDVKAVAVNYRKPDERRLGGVTASELRAYHQAGHFPPGSMGPKVEAALRFVEGGGRRAVIASLEDALAALGGEQGTQVVP